jgi:hypothetical protein
VRQIVQQKEVSSSEVFALNVSQFVLKEIEEGKDMRAISNENLATSQNKNNKERNMNENKQMINRDSPNFALNKERNMNEKHA